MVRCVFSKVMWVGRATVFLVGFAVILALVFGVASTALGADGNFFKLGQRNVAQTVSTLVKQGSGAALALQVGSNQPPLTVNRAAGTATGLSADELDGMDSSELEPRGYVQVTTSEPHFAPESSKGVTGIDRNTQKVYCFDLSFEPKAAVASANINNNATVGTAVGSAADSKCGGTSYEAAAITYAANDTDATGTMVHTDINFGIVFM
jgi:hypothetical protein